MIKLFEERLKFGVLANFYSQGVTAIVQLCGIPVYLHYLDVSDYGMWLIFSSAAQFVLLSDLGVYATSMNRVTMAAASDNWELASYELGRSLSWFVLSLPFLLVAIGVVCLLLPFFNGVFYEKEACVLFYLTVYNILFNLNGLFDSVFRSQNKYASGVLILESFRLIEWLVVVVCLVLYKDVLCMAKAYFFSRMVIIGCLATYQIKVYKILRWHFVWISLTDLKFMVLSGVEWVLYRISDIVILQGSIVIVGMVLGNSVAAAYGIFRTVARLPMQILNALVNPYWPEFSKLYGLGKISEIRDIFSRCIKRNIVIGIFLYMFLMAVSSFCVEFISRGKIEFNPMELFLLAMTAFVGSLWYPYKILMGSLNKVGVTSFVSLMFYLLGFLLIKYFSFNSIILAALFILLSEICVAAFSMTRARYVV